MTTSLKTLLCACIAVVAISGCAQDSMMKKDDGMAKDGMMKKDDTMMKKDDAMMKKP